jgi:hypothetical protein
MSKTIKDIAATQTVLNSDDYFEIQENAGTSKKIQWSTMYANFPALYVGESMQMFYSYKPISAAFPWLCMSLADATLSTTNYSQAFIDVLRARKVVYDEFNTAVSSFGGTWSGSNFTLTNNAANVAMIAELYEDWLFAGSPASGWRILVSNGVEYNITGFTVASRIITVSGSPAGTSIEIYLNRILGSTTSAKHFSWAGLGLYMTGQNKITGLRRRDKLQQFEWNNSGSGTANGTTLNADAGSAYPIPWGNGSGTAQTGFWKATTGTLRTGIKTEIESATAMIYLYVGSYA